MTHHKNTFLVSQCDLFDQMAKSASFRKSPTQSIDQFKLKKSDRSEIISKNKNYSSNFFQPIGDWLEFHQSFLSKKIHFAAIWSQCLSFKRMHANEKTIRVDCLRKGL